MDQVCLLLKMANCLAMLPFISPMAKMRMTNRVPTMMRGRATHMLSTPRPPALGGRYRYRPTPAVTMARP
jgi:hypothetical protein